MRYNLALSLVLALGDLSTISSAGRPKNGRVEPPKHPDPMVTIYTEQDCPQDDEKNHTLAQPSLNQASGCWRFVNPPVRSISSDFTHKRGYQTMKLFSDSNCEDLEEILTNIDPPSTKPEVIRATGGCYKPRNVESWNSYIFIQGPKDLPQLRGWR